MSRRTRPPNGQPYVKLFNELTYRFSPWEVWKDFIVMYACALANPFDKVHFEAREDLYLKIILKYNKKEQELFPQLVAEVVNALEENPEQDFLGKLFMDFELGNHMAGQFFTPYHVCECMAKMTVGNILPQIEEQGYISINDCCCGAGATLIAGIHEAKRVLDGKLNWQNHVLITGQDIDRTTALMCYIQLSLLGAAGYIKIGNSLTEPMGTNDTSEDYWFTPMYFSDVWTFRQLIKGKTLL